MPYHFGVPQCMQSLPDKCAYSLHLEVPIATYKGGQSSPVPYPINLTSLLDRGTAKEQSRNQLPNTLFNTLHRHSKFFDIRCRGKLSPSHPWRWRGNGSGGSAKTVTAAQTRTPSASKALSPYSSTTSSARGEITQCK